MEAVRRAGPADLARCVELVAAARRDAAGVRGGVLLSALGTGQRTRSDELPRDPSEDVSMVAGWASGGPDRILLVGEFEDVIVGMAAGEALGAVRRGGPALGRVVFCYVDADAREMGIGSAMVEELLSWFGAHGCTDVDAVALPGDRTTKQMYENAGFKARLLVLHRSTE